MNDCLQDNINKFKMILEDKFSIREVMKKYIQSETEEDVILDRVYFEIVKKPEYDEVNVDELGKGMSLFFCRSIGGIVEVNAEKSYEVIKVYCLIGFADLKDIDYTFLHCVVNEYYRLITQWFALVLNMAEWKSGTEATGIDNIIKMMNADFNDYYIGIPIVFRKYIMEIYGIDIDTILGISGSYYEKSPCNSRIYFETADNKNEKGRYTIQFKTPVEVSEGKIRLIRKILEMGSNDQYLVARRAEGKWKLIGFCAKDELAEGIAFRITGHMAWHMEILEKKTVTYHCGKYVIECEEFRRRGFLRKYKELFGKECGEKILNIFNSALKQEHGTIVIIMEKDSVCGEVTRLLKISTGMEIAETELDEKYIHNITSIDGAAFFDEDGRCHAIGVILDSNAYDIGDVMGQADRGARYNSTLKYIRTRKSKNEKVLAVIVSEDQMVNIISTME